MKGEDYKVAVKVGIVDYGMGNLRSVAKAIEKVGGDAIVNQDPKVLFGTDRLILPGVGAFRDAIAELNRRNLVTLIRDWVDADRPFLGVCLGLQLLFDRSFEGGEFEGLGVIPGDVVRFQVKEEAMKIPHMGWNSVEVRQEPTALMSGISESPHFYFVHSYYAVPARSEDVWLTSNYGGNFCAAVRRGNLFATQFHPEKSQRDGLQLLTNFVHLESLQ